MKKILVVVDMQNDFIDGALGTPEAEKIVERVVEKIGSYKEDCIVATRDTHEDNYLETAEGKQLPVKHCIRGSHGWEIRKEVSLAMPKAVIIDKPTFGSMELVRLLQEKAAKEELEIELVGLCTDICVISNAMVLKAFFPELPIHVDASCCAGVTRESHLQALEAMKVCQMIVENQ